MKLFKTFKLDSLKNLFKKKDKIEDIKVFDEVEKEPIKKEKKEKQEQDGDPIIKTDEPKGLKSQLKEVNQRLEALSKVNKSTITKEFKIPSKISREFKKMALKNKIMVLLLTRNRTMIPMITEVKDGFININGTPHQCSTDFIYLWKGKHPAIVLPEWDLNPIGTEDYYKAVEDKRVADPIAIAIRMIESKENLMKNKMNPKTLIWIGLGVAIVGYALFAGGK